MTELLTLESIPALQEQVRRFLDTHIYPASSAIGA